MKRKWTRLATGGIAVAFVAAMGMGALATPVSAETMQHTVPLAGATSAKVEISLNGGSLDVQSGAATTDLLSGAFEYGKANGEPTFDYAVENGVGDLEVSSERDFEIDWPWKMTDDFDGDWDVLLNNTVPTDLDINVNVGELDLDLDGTQVTNLDLDLAAALGTVDLRGSRTSDLNGEIEVDAGQLVLIVPTDIGVQITTRTSVVDTAIEDNAVTEVSDNVYQNDAWATAATKITLNVDMDAGQFTMKTGR